MMTVVNRIPEYRCAACGDEGGFEICDPSTDALIEFVQCSECPAYHAWKYFEYKPSSAELSVLPPF